MQARPAGGHNMKKIWKTRKGREGVSPVIATILMVAITVVLAAVLYIMVINIGGGGPSGMPTGSWGAKKILDSTSVNVDFARITPEQRPVDLEIVLVRNDTSEGKYSFSGNDDGDLILKSGADLGTLTYADLADNQKVNIGDHVKLRGLAPNSEYTMSMLWVPTGDQITSTTFRTAAA